MSTGESNMNYVEELDKVLGFSSYKGCSISQVHDGFIALGSVHNTIEEAHTAIDEAYTALQQSILKSKQ